MLKLLILTVGVTLPLTFGVMIHTQPQQGVETQPESRLRNAKIFAAGRVEGTTPDIELRSQLAGRNEKVLVEEGQFVAQGEVLLRIDDELFRHDVAVAAAELDLAQAERQRLLNGARREERSEAAARYHAKKAKLECAKLNWQRGRRLVRTQAISQQEVDEQRTSVDALTAELAAAKAHFQRVNAAARADEVQIAESRIQGASARLQLAQVRLERAQLRSPHRGQVLQINVEEGEFIGPNSPEPAIILADTSRFCVRAFVEELDAPVVGVGMHALVVADGLPDTQLTGRVTRVSPRMSRKTVWSDRPDERFETKVREVCIELAESKSLVIGLRVDVIIDRKSHSDGHTPKLEQLATSIPSTVGN